MFNKTAKIRRSTQQTNRQIMKDLNNYLEKLNDAGINTKLVNMISCGRLKMFWYKLSKNGKFTESVFLIEKGSYNFTEFKQDSKTDLKRINEYLLNFNTITPNKKEKALKTA